MRLPSVVAYTDKTPSSLREQERKMNLRIERRSAFCPLCRYCRMQDLRHIVSGERMTGTAAGSNGEVLLPVSTHSFLYVPATALKTRWVGGVAGDGCRRFRVYNCHAF